MKQLPAFFTTALLTLGTISHAQTPANAPSGSTGECKDGTYSQSAAKAGACRGHGGVKAWFSAGNSAASTASASSKASASTPSKTQTAAAGPAPAGSTGQCNDGSYSTDTTKKGACRGHKGVKAWFAPEPATAAAPSAKSASSSSSPAPQSSGQGSGKASPPVPSHTNAAAPTRTQAPGGGNGQVWVNTSTKVYHCPGDRYYGKTKEGSYMNEADARSKGIRPDAGKPCTR